MKPPRRPSISSDRNRAVLMNVQSPHKWWSTLKSVVFGSSSSVPLLVSEGGGLVGESVGKADLQSDHLDSKQSREAVDMPLTSHPSPSLITFAFRSREVRLLLLDLDPYSGIGPLGIFPIFRKRTADVMAPCLNVGFRRLVRLGSFLACWRQAIVTPIPKCPPSSSVANYRLVSITSVLSKVLSICCLFVLYDFWNAMECLKPPSLLIGKVWVPVMHFHAATVMHFCACPIHCKVLWSMGRAVYSCRLCNCCKGGVNFQSRCTPMQITPGYSTGTNHDHHLQKKLSTENALTLFSFAQLLLNL